MFVVDPRKSVADLFAPDGHREEPQRWIIEAVLPFVRLFFYPIIERQISMEQSCPRIGGRDVGRQAAPLFQCLLSPVESINDVVLVAEVPRVLPGPSAELNAAQKKRKNEKNRENAQANFTSPRRNYCTAQERLCDHPQKRKGETRFNSFQQFVFET